MTLSDTMPVLAGVGWQVALSDGGLPEPRQGTDWLMLGAAVIVGGIVALVWSVRRRFPGESVPVGMLWYANRFWTGMWYDVRRVGPCTVPVVGPVVLTANHGSTVDPLMLYATCPHRIMGFLIAREYARLPVVRHAISAVRCIPVDRDGRDTAPTRTAIRRLREGLMLGIFIEGRIPKPGETEPPKDGVALLALMTGATVVPAHISGLIHRDSAAASFFARHRPRVRYGAPVDLREFSGRDRETLKRATDKIYAAILDLKRQAQARGERVESSPRPL